MRVDGARVSPIAGAAGVAPGRPGAKNFSIFFVKVLDKHGKVQYNIGVKEREVAVMAKFPMNKRVKVDSNEHYDFYIMHCDHEWYVEAFPIGTFDHTRKTLAGFSKSQGRA